MMFLLNTNAPMKDRKPNVDGKIIRRPIAVKQSVKIDCLNWALEGYIFSWQIIIAVGIAAEIFEEKFNQKMGKKENIVKFSSEGDNQPIGEIS
jgi:hypothetical protein